MNYVYFSGRHMANNYKEGNLNPMFKFIHLLLNVSKNNISNSFEVEHEINFYYKDLYGSNLNFCNNTTPEYKID